MDSSKNRIPAKESKQYGSWNPPDIHNGNIVEVVHSGDHQPSAACVQNVALGKKKQDVMTLEQLEKITAQAQQEGFQTGMVEGQKKGYQDGLVKGQQEINARLVQLQTVIDQLMKPLADQDHQLEVVLVQLVQLATEAMILRELDDNRIALLRRIINESVGALPLGSRNIRVALNPDDFAAIQGEGGGESPEWQLRADPALQAGGCRVETNQSLVDFSLESRIRLVMDQLIENADSAEVDAARDDGL